MALTRRVQGLLVAALAPAALAGCLLPYPVRTTLELGSLSIDALEHADLDGDGAADLVVAAGCDLSPRLVQPNGTFGTGPEAAVGVTVPDERTGFATGDLDGDGDDDVVVAGSTCGTPGHALAVVVSAGDGTLAPAGSVPLASAVWGVDLADLDEDGHLDLVVGAGTTIEVRSGSGDGGFGTPIASRSVGAGARALDLGDVTSDGHVDVVVGTSVASTHTINAIPGDGAGSLGAVVATVVPRSPLEVALGDLDEDGADDLVVTPQWSSGQPKGFTVHEAIGGGAFAPPTHHPVTGETPFATGIGDIDGDGHLDVVATAISVGVLLGDGSGHLDGAVMWDATAAAAAVRLADHDGDGDDDLALVSQGGDEVATATSRGDGRLRAAQVAPDVGVGARWSLVGDADGDGRADVILGGESEGVWVMRNRGDGVVVPGPVSEEISLDEDAVTADLDADGDLDLLAEEGVAWNDGSGRFASQTDPAWARRAAAGDVDGDGDIDIVESIEHARVRVRINDGAGAFSDDTVLGHGVRSPRLADVDGDGDLDLIARREADSRPIVVPGTGDGGFSGAEAQVLVDQPIRELFADDVDGDAQAEVIAVATTEVLLLRATGAVVSSVPIAGGWVEPADVDGDGDVDLVRATDSELAVTRNRGDGTFGPLTTGLDWGGTGFWSLAAGDLDADGKDDLVVAGVELSEFAVLLSQ